MNEVIALSEKLKLTLSALPEKPGVYQFVDDKAKLIYVGKAKNLRKRVSSYFQRDNALSGKTRIMVKKIYDILYLIVDNEQEALLLENNLIKEHQPRYNVLLKDDKTYPWIVVKNEPFPRVFSTRHYIRDGSTYFGPYAGGMLMKTLLDLVRQLFPIRTCKLNLSPENIRKKKFKICLEYHIGNCKGPCEGLQSEEEYQENIKQIKEIIKGNLATVVTSLRKQMLEYASNLEFEKAQITKEKLDNLERYRSKSTVVGSNIQHVDVFSVLADEDAGYVNYLKVFQGAIVQTHTIELKKKLDETESELLEYAITEIRQRFESSAPEIIVPIKPETLIQDVKYTVPTRGDKYKLLELSQRNTKFYQLEKQKRQDLVDPERHSIRLMQTLQKDLHLKELPTRIECFDNSNIQGDFAVAALVVFSNAKPNKKEYRHFNIKTVSGPNDFASMEEVVYRRYKRMLEENQPLPQLVVIDGGKGQLSSAVLALEKLQLRGKLAIIGIAKRLEEIYFPGDSDPLYLNKKSESLKIIQHIRDEAHRFGISHHRGKRQKEMKKTELTAIQGIGISLSEKLLKHFGSVKKIERASLEELKDVVGKAKADLVFRHFHKDKNLN